MKYAKKLKNVNTHEEEINEIGNRVLREMKSLLKFGVVTAISLTIIKLWLG